MSADQQMATCSECGAAEPDWNAANAFYRAAQVERMRQALEPFAALARIKGGTPDAEKLKALIVYMMEHNKPGEGVDVIYQFTSACLRARDVLTESATQK